MFSTLAWNLRTAFKSLCAAVVLSKYICLSSLYFNFLSIKVFLPPQGTLKDKDEIFYRLWVKRLIAAVAKPYIDMV